jgi:hypothetical protein
MAKFYGIIGFAKTGKTAPGVWAEAITEKYYFGDVIKNSRRSQTGDGLNDNMTISNEISIVADAFANENFQSIRYINWMGSNWKITNVDVQRPLLF